MSQAFFVGMEAGRIRQRQRQTWRWRDRDKDRDRQKARETGERKRERYECSRRVKAGFIPVITVY